MNAKRCPLCEVHFSGEAWEFADDSERDDEEDTSTSSWATITGVVLLASLGLVLIIALLQAISK